MEKIFIDIKDLNITEDILFLILSGQVREYREGYDDPKMRERTIERMRKHSVFVDVLDPGVLFFVSMIKSHAEGKLDSYLKEQINLLDEYDEDDSSAHATMILLSKTRQQIKTMTPVDWLKQMEEDALATAAYIAGDEQAFQETINMLNQYLNLNLEVDTDGNSGTKTTIQGEKMDIENNWFLKELKTYTDDELEIVEKTSKFIGEANAMRKVDSKEQYSFNSGFLFLMNLDYSSKLVEFYRLLSSISNELQDNFTEDCSEHEISTYKMNYVYLEEENTYDPEHLYQEERERKNES